MKPIRILVVDDSTVMRRLISDVLGEERDFAVVGVAANGMAALGMVPALSPDCITLDVEMPEMDGIEAVTEIHRQWPALPVIMFSALTEHGAARTLEALARGAVDYVTKPATVGSFGEAISRLREQLVPLIRAHCKVRSEAVPELPAPVVNRSAGGQPISALCIGTSTGGPNALAAVLPHLPKAIGVPVFIVQHMPPIFTAMLAERLNSVCDLEVKEGADGEAVRPGVAYFAPGGFHMEVHGNARAQAIRIHEGPPEHSCRPAADVLFRSVVPVFGPAVLALVMTGMGYDGALGCEQIARAGGEIWIQDKPSSIVWGMPGAVAQARVYNRMLPLDTIGRTLSERLTAVPAGAGRS